MMPKKRIAAYLHLVWATWDTDRLKKYINRQKQHHNECNLIRDLEEIKESVPGEGRSAKLG
jgi:hypothetical protein